MAKKKIVDNFLVGTCVNCPQCGMRCWVEDSMNGNVLVPDLSELEEISDLRKYASDLEKDLRDLLDALKFYGRSENIGRPEEEETLLSIAEELHHKWFAEPSDPE